MQPYAALSLLHSRPGRSTAPSEKRSVEQSRVRRILRSKRV